MLSCKGKAGKPAAETSHQQHEQYTCPMHPQIVKDKPGTCPICGMELVKKEAHKELMVDSTVTILARPVNEQVVASVPAIMPTGGTRIVSSTINGIITYDTRRQTSLSTRVSGRIERLLIKYNYQPVRKGQLIMEIYSPDLAAAQRELIYVAGNSPAHLPGAKQRLLLLGMSAAQVEQVVKSGNILYRVPVYSNSDGYVLDQSAQAAAGTTTAGSAMASASTADDGMGGMSSSSASNNAASPVPAPAPTPVLVREGQYVTAGQTVFTIYEATDLIAAFALPPDLAPYIKKGRKLLYYPGSNKNAMRSAKIGLLEPVYRNGQNFLMARVYVDRNDFKVGQLLTGVIPVVYTGGWWVPKKAVWRLGARSIVFKKDGNLYTPVEVQSGVEADGFVKINTDIGSWQIASNAAFLIDSESFIKASSKTKQ
jgi:biotin carboxyl carrier protein